MRHFPIFLDLRGRRVLVLGADAAAGRKVALLVRAGAQVLVRSRFDSAELPGCTIAIATSTVPEAELQSLAAAARAAGIPLNVVDRPDLCSFIMPALIDRAPLTVAVASDGTAPLLARMVRIRIEALLPSGYGRLATLAQSFRTELRRRLPDVRQRRRALERALAGAAAEFALAGREAEARAAFAQALEEGAEIAGLVFLIEAPAGPPDLLTLRALRLLGEADVIAHDSAVPPAVLDLARRDAARIALTADQTPAGALLVRLAGAGNKVVRLTAPAAPCRAAEAEALRGAGTAFEIVPGV